MSDLPVLDWRPNHRPESRNYPMATALPRQTRARKSKQYKVGARTDQGAEGACVGHAWTAEALADPVPVDLTRLKAHAPRDPDDFARFIYGMARYLDEWRGEDYEGTSTNAGALAMENIGLLKEWRWCFNGAPEVADTIAFKSPVILGIPWYESMYEAPAGVVQVGGEVVGGHCILASGVTTNSERLNGATTITLTNSWGTGWGINGQAEIELSKLGELLRQDGEACVPVRRSYGR